MSILEVVVDVLLRKAEASREAKQQLGDEMPGVAELSCALVREYLARNGFEASKQAFENDAVSAVTHSLSCTSLVERDRSAAARTF